jgi:sterol desaturase/sphingolipid hydroxylase (fatty acid hydroxylase superfamily)
MPEATTTILWIVYIICLVIILEILTYGWHRWCAHSDFIPGLHGTHSLHHQADLNDHTAEEDFLWVIGAIILLLLALLLVLYFDFCTATFVLVTILVVIAVATVNYLVHAAYHRPEHWLNQYEWFQQHKAWHFLHHQYPDKNYGIVTFIPDWVAGTFVNG